MALSDPQSVTIGTAHSLARTGLGLGAFSKDDQTVQMTIQHVKTSKGRYRRSVRVYQQKIAADPFLVGRSSTVDAAVTITVDVPSQGFTVTEQKDILTGLTTWLTATSNANAVKLLGGEA